MPNMTLVPVRTMILDLDPSTSVEDAEHLASDLRLDLSWSLIRMSDYVAVRLGEEDYPIKSRAGESGKWLPMPEQAKRA